MAEPASGSRGLQRGEGPRGEPEGQLWRPLCPGDNCPRRSTSLVSCPLEGVAGGATSGPWPAVATTTDTSGPGPAARATGLYGGRGTRPNGTWRPGEIQPHVGEGQGLLHRRAHRWQPQAPASLSGPGELQRLLGRRGTRCSGRRVNR